MLIKNLFLQELISNSARIFIILICILPLTEVFGLIDQVLTGSVPTITIITLMLFGTLSSLPMILTISSFLAVVITINRYCKDYEFIIWLSSAVSPWYWLKQILFFCLPLAIICGVCTLYITPWASKKSSQYTQFLLSQEINKVIVPGLFKENNDGHQVFYIESYSLNNGNAKNIFINYNDYEANNNHLVTKHLITAKSGIIYNNNGIFKIILDSGSQYNISYNHNNNVLTFKNFIITLKRQYAPNNHTDISSVNFTELLSNNTVAAKSELSWRISTVIMLVVMCIIALPISINIGRVQSNFTFILPPAIYALYQNLILSINGYIHDGKIGIMVIFVVHTIILLLAIAFIYLKTFPKGYLQQKIK
jgi:lipopolysaccharide export system permease protein